MEKLGLKNKQGNPASRARDIFESSEVDEKRQLLNFVFQNLELKEKKLSVTLREPFKLPEIAYLLRRNANYVRENYLMPLIKTEELKYVFPHQPNHPQQAYQTKKS
jgi:hypothetical protein